MRGREKDCHAVLHVQRRLEPINFQRHQSVHDRPPSHSQAKQTSAEEAEPGQQKPPRNRKVQCI